MGAIAIDPFDPNQLLLTAGGALFKSTDAGTSWRFSNSGMESTQPRTIAFDPIHTGIIYSGTLGAGVWRSADGGSTWQLFNTGMGNLTVVALNFDQVSGVLYAAAADGAALKLLPGALAWTNITLGLPSSTPVVTLLPHPAIPKVLFAGTGGGVYISPDDGAHWHLSNTTPASLVASDGVGVSFYFVGVHGGLFATSDMGNTWFSALSGLQNTFVGALSTVVSGGGSVLYAGSDFGVYSPGVELVLRGGNPQDLAAPYLNSLLTRPTRKCCSWAPRKMVFGPAQTPGRPGRSLRTALFLIKFMASGSRQSGTIRCMRPLLRVCTSARAALLVGGRRLPFLCPRYSA